jgi:hypothetical protein
VSKPAVLLNEVYLDVTKACHDLRVSGACASKAYKPATLECGVCKHNILNYGDLSEQEWNCLFRWHEMQDEKREKSKLPVPVPAARSPVTPYIPPAPARKAAALPVPARKAVALPAAPRKQTAEEFDREFEQLAMEAGFPCKEERERGAREYDAMLRREAFWHNVKNIAIVCVLLFFFHRPMWAILKWATKLAWGIDSKKTEQAAKPAVPASAAKTQTQKQRVTNEALVTGWIVETCKWLASHDVDRNGSGDVTCVDRARGFYERFIERYSSGGYWKAPVEDVVFVQNKSGPDYNHLFLRVDWRDERGNVVQWGVEPVYRKFGRAGFGIERDSERNPAYDRELSVSDVYNGDWWDYGY